MSEILIVSFGIEIDSRGLTLILISPFDSQGKSEWHKNYDEESTIYRMRISLGCSNEDVGQMIVDTAKEYEERVQMEEMSEKLSQRWALALKHRIEEMKMIMDHQAEKKQMISS